MGVVPRQLLTIAVLFVLLTAGVMVVQSGLLATVDPPADDEYDRTTVELVDTSGERLAEVRVRVADTPEKRYLGLSATESLDPREGMLFVHDSEGQYAYVMRDMAFPLDIVFVAPNGTVTTIHHAPLPPEGTSESDLTRYRGEGRYVLELPLGTANETGLNEGDRVVIPAEDEWVAPGETEADTTDENEDTGSTAAPATPSATSTPTTVPIPGFGIGVTLAAIATVASYVLSRHRRA